VLQPLSIAYINVPLRKLADQAAVLPFGDPVAGARYLFQLLAVEHLDMAPSCLHDRDTLQEVKRFGEALVQNYRLGLGQRHGGVYRAIPSFSG
jgi:hypothetical protein